MDEDQTLAACLLLESAAAYGATDDPRDGSSSSQGSFLLQHELLRELNHLFASKASTSAYSGVVLEGRLWGEIALKGIALGSVVRALTNRMETGGRLGMLAANVYLGLYLIPNCPRFRLFSPLVFHSLVRCIRNACKALGRPSETSEDRRPGEIAGKKRQRRGKRQREVQPQQEGFDPTEAVSFDQPQANANATVDEIMLILNNLQCALAVLPLKEDQASLKALVELLVEVPHLVPELADFEADAALPTMSRTRGGAQSRVNKPSLIFGSLELLLDPRYGETLDTAIVILKQLTPSLLLSRMEGSLQQRAQIRTAGLDFLLRGVLGREGSAMRTAVPALCRYMSFKAPEKSDPRAQAVDTILRVVKPPVFVSSFQFGKFVAKLSRGKPRHRLFAVDLALSLLTTLPDPLGLESAQSDTGYEQEPVHINCNDAELADSCNRNTENPVEAGEGNIDMEEERAEQAETLGFKAAASKEKENSTPTQSIYWGIACLEALLHRCSDKAPAIRARALANLAHVLEQLSSEVRNRFYLQVLLGLRSSQSSTEAPSSSKWPISAVALDCFTPQEDLPNMGGVTPSPDPQPSLISATPLSPGAQYGDLISLLCKRSLDEKAVVRKSALLVITKSTILMGKPPDKTVLEAMGAACSDSMVSIRKAALSAFSEVARRFATDKLVTTEWLQSVLPLVHDAETSIQEEVLALFEELVLDQISTVATLKLPSLQSNSTSFSVSGRAESAQKQANQELERLLPPGVLSLLNGINDGGTIASCVKRICLCLGKKKHLRNSLALGLQQLITLSASFFGKKRSVARHVAPQGAWLLLAEVSAFLPKVVGWDFLWNHWQLFDWQDKGRLYDDYQTPLTHPRSEKKSSAWPADRVYLLQTISNVAARLPPEAAVDLATELMEHLETFSMHPAEVGAHVKALTVLCGQKAATPQEGEQIARTWVKDLLVKAEKIFQEYVEMEDSELHFEDNHHFQTPCSSTRKRSGAGRSGQSVSSKTRNRRAKQCESSNDRSDPCNKIVTAIFTVGALVLVSPTVSTGNLITPLQALVTPKDEIKNFRGSHTLDKPYMTENLAPAVCAQTWIALGKLCLVDDKLAKRLIPLFVQELEKANVAAIRNNIIVALTDLCIHYTFLIDG